MALPTINRRILESPVLRYCRVASLSGKSFVMKNITARGIISQKCSILYSSRDVNHAGREDERGTREIYIYILRQRAFPRLGVCLISQRDKIRVLQVARE